MKGSALIAAIFIIIGALISFFIWNEGNSSQLQVDHLGHFKQQDDQLIIQYGSQLWWLTPDEHLQRHINLESLGINVHGDYDFFSNGDLLIYHRTQALSLWDNIKQYLRLSKRTEINYFSENGDDGFYRCQLSTLQCLPFGLNLPVLNHHFRMVIDKQTDSIYLSDISAHKLYKISEQGATLATSDLQQFKFPNQLSLVGDVLWLADTNHHRLVSLNTDNDYFAQEISSMEVKYSAIHRWPHQFSLQKSSVWVNVADNDMSNGAIIEYDFQGKQLNQAQPQFLTDPTTLITFNKKLWVADFDSTSIEQFTLQGDSLGEFTFPEFLPYVVERQQKMANGKHLELLGMVMFIATLLIGIAASWLIEKKETIALVRKINIDPVDKLIREAKAQNVGMVNPVHIVWLENRFFRHRKIYYSVLSLCVLPMGFSVLFYIQRPELKLMAFGLFITFLLIWIGCHFIIRYLSSFKLGVQGDSVITEAKGKTEFTRLSHIAYHSTYLLTAESAIPLGSKQQSIFNQKQLMQYLYPYLQSENKVGLIELIKQLWHLKEPLFLLNSLIITSLFVYFSVGMFW